jgi:chromosome segregation ATPase
VKDERDIRIEELE